jgi:hypothetical protein
MPGIEIRVEVRNTISTLDFASLSIGEAHQELGKAVAAQVQQILHRRFQNPSPQSIHPSNILAGKQLSSIARLQQDPTLPTILRQALELYLDCLNRWSRGAGLESAGRKSWSGVELAMQLQGDQPGCQSGVYREGDGSVLFWHTEEDVDEPGFARVDQPRLMRFSNPINKSTITSFIYPDLLPGPNFNWRSDGMVQFADSLILREDCRKEGNPANLIAWLSLLLEGEMPTPRIIQYLQPVFDGYAIFHLAPGSAGTRCRRVEFSVDRFQETELPTSPGGFLVQSNAFSLQAGSLAIQFERDPFPSRRHFESRIRRAEKALNNSPSKVDLERIQRMLASRAGGRWAFANKDVKAHLFGRLSSESLEIHSHPGMALLSG